MLLKNPFLRVTPCFNHIFVKTKFRWIVKSAPTTEAYIQDTIF